MKKLFVAIALIVLVSCNDATGPTGPSPVQTQPNTPTPPQIEQVFEFTYVGGNPNLLLRYRVVEAKRLRVYTTEVIDGSEIGPTTEVMERTYHCPCSPKNDIRSVAGLYHNDMLEVALEVVVPKCPKGAGGGPTPEPNPSPNPGGPPAPNPTPTPGACDNYNMNITRTWVKNDFEGCTTIDTTHEVTLRLSQGSTNVAEETFGPGVHTLCAQLDCERYSTTLWVNAVTSCGGTSDSANVSACPDDPEPNPCDSVTGTLGFSIAAGPQDRPACEQAYRVCASGRVSVASELVLSHTSISTPETFSVNGNYNECAWVCSQSQSASVAFATLFVGKCFQRGASVTIPIWDSNQ